MCCVPHMYQCPYYVNVPMYNYGRQSVYWTLEGYGHGYGNTVISGRTPDEWMQYTEFLVNEGLREC